MKKKILSLAYAIGITIISILIWGFFIHVASSQNPDKHSMEISDEAITLHYEWDDATSTMTAEVPLTAENYCTTCKARCNY
jgi:hypothetical protein